jgi:HSP20 family molecular chaperone IbpA
MKNKNVMTKSSNGATSEEQTWSGRCFRPNVDILEKPDELLVLADVPGTKPDGIDVKFEDGKLMLRAKVEPRQSSDQPYLLQEYGMGDFYRTFQVGEAIDVAKISAEYDEGVLTLHLPKASTAKPRKISVEMK